MAEWFLGSIIVGLQGLRQRNESGWSIGDALAIYSSSSLRSRFFLVESEEAK